MSTEATLIYKHRRNISLNEAPVDILIHTNVPSTYISRGSVCLCLCLSVLTAAALLAATPATDMHQIDREPTFFPNHQSDVT